MLHPTQRHMTDRLNEIPRWLLRILADTAPEKTFDVVVRAARLRGDREILDVVLTDPNSARACRSLWLTLAAWIQSGSPLLSLDTGAERILDNLTTPRFHALTLPVEDPDDGRTYVMHFDTEKRGMVDVFVWPSFKGPILSVIFQPEGSDFGIELTLSGEWDAIRWQAACATGSEVHPSDLPWIRRAINAVAAVEESREILRRASPARKTPRKKSRRSNRSRAPKPITYWLDANALDAWTERTASRTSPATPASSDREPTGNRRLHQCREHARRIWVKAPKEGEAILAIRPGKAGSLYCVKRRVEAHARGEGVRPRSCNITPIR